jgi:hypothetical protein
MVVNLQQELFRDYLDADNALLYSPGGQPTATQVTFHIAPKGPSMRHGGLWAARACSARPTTTANS